jgi:phosphate transport system substrate-binding protein
MRFKVLIAAIAAAVLPVVPLAAQDVTLIAREGGIVLSGSLQGYDGEFYRIQTSYGLLTVDGEGVICEGPACPDLVAPKALIRVVGVGDVGHSLLPGLFQAFAEQRGLLYQPISDDPYRALILDPTTRSELADLQFDPLGPAAATLALQDGAADLKLGFLTDPSLATHSLAMDALVAITAPDNPTPRLSTGDLARILGGEVENWAEVGGPDMPLVLHALRPETDMQGAIAERLGLSVAADVLHGGQTSLAQAVARDPWAIAVTGRSVILPARRIPMTDSCGFPLLPTPLAVKAEDYPLAMPLVIQTPKRRLPLLTREFLTFLRSPAAQTVVAANGFADRSVSRQSMTTDGMRLINAIKGAGEDITLADLKRLADLMDGADRISLTFRFEDGSSTLDARSLDNLADLAQLIAAGQFRNERLVLAGFSDGSGPAAANLALSIERAARVAQELAAVGPDLDRDDLPSVDGFGEALPLACDETAVGRQLNRRVELWVLPDFAVEGDKVPQP